MGITGWLKKHLPEKLWKPVFDCPFCMTPWYGTLIYILFFHIGIEDWLLSVGVAAGFQIFYVGIFNLYLDLIDINKTLKSFTEEEKELES